jgi:mediator of RNA polymerase II transcription subunit 31
MNFFGDPAFINYLKYLLYWTRPEYARYIRYPQCLHFLRLLQDEAFRARIASQDVVLAIEDQQGRFFHAYRRNRLDLTLPEVELKLPESA